MKEDNSNKKLLEVYIQEVLKEQSLYKAFVEPFTDVIDTAKHGVEKVTKTTTSNLKKLGKQTAILAIPFIAPSEITRIGQEEQQKLMNSLDELDSRYADVLKRNIDTLQTRDVWGLTFLLNPSMALGTRVAQKAPEIALGTIEALTGGNKVVRSLKNKMASINKKQASPVGRMGSEDLGPGYSGVYDVFGIGESRIRKNKKKAPLLKEQQLPDAQEERTDKGLQQVYAYVVQQVLNSPKIQQQIEQSQITQKLRQTAIDVILDRAKKVSKFDDWNDFATYAGKDFSKFEKEVEDKLPDDATDEQIEELRQEMIPELKNIYRQIYERQLNQLKQKAPGAEKMVNDAVAKLNDILKQ